MKVDVINDGAINTSSFSLYDRPEILTKEVARELNSYRNWGQFGLQVEPLYDKTEQNIDEFGHVTTVKKDEGDNPDNWWATADSDIKFLGTKSLFNNVNAVIFSNGTRFSAQHRLANNMPLLDSNMVRQTIRERGGCSIKELVEASEKGIMGRAIYNYSDFMYCKHLGKLSNNYLITLRRFPLPCGDHINFSSYDLHNSSLQKVIESNEYEINQHAPDQGRLVTWLGTPGNSINDILKFNVLMPYEEMNSTVHDINGKAENAGFLGAMINTTNKYYVEGALSGAAGTKAISYLKQMLGTKLGGLIEAPENTDWAYHFDKTKPYGPVDVISTTHVRKGAGDGGGLSFEQDFSLTFDYELRSYDGINTRSAFMDLLSNILAVTYANGRFWGGGVRAVGASSAAVFTNLPIFDLHTPLTYNQIKDASLNSISSVAQAINGGKEVTSFGDIANMAKNMLSSIGNILVGGALNALGRPIKEGLNSLLTNDPVGLWHLTIGNPKHPIMSMGNMILTSCEISQYGPLGLDDFPTGIKVTVGLKHAMPRDRMKIEQMYTMGDNRTYIPMGKDISLMYEAATEMKTRNKGVAKDIDSAKAGTGTSTGVVKTKSSTEDREDSRELNAIYMKYFGTADRGLIQIDSEEGHLGSSKAITQEEAMAEPGDIQDGSNPNTIEGANAYPYPNTNTSEPVTLWDKLWSKPINSLSQYSIIPGKETSPLPKN